LWLPQTGELPQGNEATADSIVTQGQGTALLVDDEELVRLSTSDMLHDLGYSVIEAASAEAALEVLRGGDQIDVLITDHLMPGMNGTELALAIRATKPDIPVLIVSGYAEQGGIEVDLPRLTKPFRKDELAESLAQLSTT
jgi:CheY-like chemotaxis protein